MMTMKAYNFYKDGCEICKENSKLLHRVVGLDIEELESGFKPEVEALFNVKATPTVVLVNEENEVTKIERKLTMDDLFEAFK